MLAVGGELPGISHDLSSDGGQELARGAAACERSSALPVLL